MQKIERLRSRISKSVEYPVQMQIIDQIEKKLKRFEHLLRKKWKEVLKVY